MLVTANTQVELWRNFLIAGQNSSGVKLTENQEAYTVFLLQRFLKRTELSGIVFALNYLESLLESRFVRSTMLSDTADASLIFAGLYPERTRRLNVSSDYFINMSKMCFFELADLCSEMKKEGEASLYREISDSAENIAMVMFCGKNTKVSPVIFWEMIRSKTSLN